MKEMKTRILTLLLALFTLGASAQNAKAILDKTAALCTQGAVQAKFTAKAPQGTSSGTLVAQGNKFTLQSGQASIWFDGKTEWSLIPGSGEVNVTEPTAKEIASMNPMNFVRLYKSGYKLAAKSSGSNYEVHMTATSKSKAIKEMYVYVDQKTYKPKTIKMRTGAKGWTTITVSSFAQQGKKADSYFRFNAKDHPKVQVVDLR